MDCKTDTCKTISGINCNVTNCAYHHEGNKCHAGSIKVGNGVCATCGDTACETFKPKM